MVHKIDINSETGHIVWTTVVLVKDQLRSIFRLGSLLSTNIYVGWLVCLFYELPNSTDFVMSLGQAAAQPWRLRWKTTTQYFLWSLSVYGLLPSCHQPSCQPWVQSRSQGQCYRGLHMAWPSLGCLHTSSDIQLLKPTSHSAPKTST